MSNVMIGSPTLSTDDANLALNYFCGVITNIFLDAGILADCLWALSNLTEDKNLKKKIFRNNEIL